ncbi:MAG: hypothetical protein ACE5IL_04825 [Myxococcota bacterium]
MSPRERDPHTQAGGERAGGPLAPSEERRIDSLVRGLPRIAPSPGFEAAFWARLARERAPAPRSRTALWWNRWRTPVGALGAACALGLFALWIDPRDSALPDRDWSLVADGERFEILLEGDLDLLASLDVVEAWDGSEGG